MVFKRSWGEVLDAAMDLYRPVVRRGHGEAEPPRVASLAFP